MIREKNPLEIALDKCKKVFWITFAFAFCINLLTLLTAFYSLQVLDRVIGSGNLSTLLMLSIIVASAYFVHGLLQIARSFTLVKIGEWLDRNVSYTLFARSIASAALKPTLSSGELLRDFQTVKSFVTSAGINTLFDMPWTVIYIAVIFMLHKYIGYLTIIGGAIIVSLALFNAIATNRTLGKATEYSLKSINHAEIACRNAEVVEAMGMIKNVSLSWNKFNKLALNAQSYASYRNGIISNISALIRSWIQMFVTGISAYVVVSTGGQDMTTGTMILSSILVGKALGPFNNFISIWKSISSTLKSYERINKAFEIVLVRDDAMPLPGIKGHLTVEDLSYATAQPNQNLQQKTISPVVSMPKYILKDISFSVNPGEILTIIGPTAAGKSTLSKIIVGVWKSSQGEVKLDGGEIYLWNREDFGHNVGYLPQDIELFSGPIKQNIARMKEDINPELVVEAAKIAGAHEMILKLPHGYDTDIGVSGSNLSGGQKQRIALARAFYGNPKLLVLDEPNANLDEAGEIALSDALKQAKKREISVVVISHRHSVLSVADKILILQDGNVFAYGDKKKIMKHVTILDSGTMHIN